MCADGGLRVLLLADGEALDDDGHVFHVDVVNEVERNHLLKESLSLSLSLSRWISNDSNPTLSTIKFA